MRTVRPTAPLACLASVAPLLLSALLGSASIGCASRAAPVASPAGGQAAPGPDEPPEQAAACHEGTLTFYSDALAGRRTASGERYDPAAMTAAHRSLPFGTRLRVSWGGRDVWVKVNDRGGPKGGVDLSKRAAGDLGMIRAGRVRGLICPGGEQVASRGDR